MRSHSSLRSVRAVALATVLVVGSACIEGHQGDPQSGGVLAPGAIGRDPAVINEITGTVLDDVTWTPIVGARIFIGDTETYSAADGSYRLSPISGFVVLLEATKDGYERRSVVFPLTSGVNTYRIFMKRPAA